MESIAPLGAEDSKGEQMPLEMEEGIETRDTSNGEGASGPEQAKDGEKKKDKSMNIKICTFNVCLGLRCKINLIKDFLNKNQIDIWSVCKAESFSLCANANLWSL